MHKDRYLFLLPVLIVVTLWFAFARSNIPITKITESARINLPEPIKQRLLTENDSELLYVDYHDRKIQYYFRSINGSRCQQILNYMRKLAVSLRYPILEGNYLFLLHDGAHHDYGYPLLTYAAMHKYLPQVALIPDPYALQGYNGFFRALDKGVRTQPWRKKTAKIFWRGSAYGVGPENNDLNGSDRLRFMNLAHKLPFADVGFTSYTNQHNPMFKARLSALHSLKERVNPVQSMSYKYLIDIDGNSCSYTRMAWILYSNSVLLKHQSDKVQWYYAQMQPYVHYIPINADFSNLEAQFMWAEANPHIAQTIAENGRRFARKNFNNHSIAHAMQRALVRYNILVQDY